MSNGVEQFVIVNIIKHKKMKKRFEWNDDDDDGFQIVVFMLFTKGFKTYLFLLLICPEYAGLVCSVVFPH